MDFKPFRGVNCSDAAGGQIDFKSMQDMIRDGNGGDVTIGKVWRDDYMNVQYFNYYKSDDEKKVIHQAWIDDDVSLSELYKYVKEAGLRGTGPFTFGMLDPDGPGADQAQKMWDALKLAV